MEKWCPDDTGRDSWVGLGESMLGGEHASTPQSGVEAPRLLKRSLPRLYYCCCCVLCFVFCVLCFVFCVCVCCCCSCQRLTEITVHVHQCLRVNCAAPWQNAWESRLLESRPPPRRSTSRRTEAEKNPKRLKDPLIAAPTAIRSPHAASNTVCLHCA